MGYIWSCYDMTRFHYTRCWSYENYFLGHHVRNLCSTSTYILTRPTFERRKTLGCLRSMNPNMTNHLTSQSQACQFLKTKMLNVPIVKIGAISDDDQIWSSYSSSKNKYPHYLLFYNGNIYIFLQYVTLSLKTKWCSYMIFIVASRYRKFIFIIQRLISSSWYPISAISPDGYRNSPGGR